MVSSQDIAGALGAIGTSFFTIVPFGLLLIVQGIMVIVDAFLYDWIALGLTVAGAVIGTIIAGLIGANSKAFGAGGGAIAGAMFAGIYFLYSFVSGAVSLALFNSMTVMIQAVVIISLSLVTAIYAGIVYLVVQGAKQ
jgi:hypothetical protein